MNLVTQGQPGAHGIQLSASTRAPLGSQAFAGAVSLQGDVELRAGGAISFSSTVDGANRLSLSAGGAITFAGDVGSNAPLKGLTLVKASRVTVSQGLALDGSGTAVGTSGLVIGANVHNVVFSTKTPDTSGRTVSGFSDAGILFLGGSQGSRIIGVTSTGNGVGIKLGRGNYAGTVIASNVFNENIGAGVSLVGARGVRIGVNGIVSNGTFGITAVGLCQGSVVVSSGGVGDSNPLGQIQNYTNSRIVGSTVIQNGTGLQLPLTGFYLAQKAVATTDWYFPTQSDFQGPFVANLSNVGTFSATGEMTSARSLHTATLLSDGRVLLAGGAGAGGDSATVLSTAEIYSPGSRTFAATGSMSTPRLGAAAVRLADGRVLLVGGEGNDHLAMASAEVFDPATASWSLTAPMSTGRANPTATLLQDGTVLVVGGYSINSDYDPLASAEIYNPVTGTFSPTGSMAIARRNHTATLLANGRVLVAGGYNGINSTTDGTGNVNAPEIYDPAKRTFSATADMTSARRYPTATMLPDGKVLIAGGYDDTNAVLLTADVYNPTAGTFAPTGSMLTARGRHTATDLKNGKVLIAGGYDTAPIASAELYDIAKGTFSATGSMATARWRHAETRLLNGDVLITGGKNETTAVKTAELFNAQVAPNGVIWLQRDGSGSDPSFAALARELARQTNSIVVAPKFGSLENPGPSVSGANLGAGVAQLFERERVALNRSATAAGFQGPLPQMFLLAGLGKGGGFATSVGAVTVDSGAAVNLLGVVMIDGFADANQFAASVAKLDSLGIPNYQIAGPPSASNAWGRTTDLIAALHPGQFVGIETPLRANTAVITASAGWINDIYAGYGPTDPKFGVYGNPNDGTYVPGQRFTIGGVTATVLSTDGDVDVIGTRGKSVTVDAMSYRDLTGTTFTAFVSTGIAASAPHIVRPTVTVVSASPGKIRVSLSAAQTAVLTPAKTYYLFLRESHSDGTVRTRVAGTVKVRNASP
ncbi:MAG: hypothetical protein NTY17_01335 [Planctomycetia bacterium]|nr:hypothetical protein [Planctomycetia bacterium]